MEVLSHWEAACTIQKEKNIPRHLSELAIKRLWSKSMQFLVSLTQTLSALTKHPVLNTTACLFSQPRKKHRVERDRAGLFSKAAAITTAVAAGQREKQQRIWKIGSKKTDVQNCVQVMEQEGYAFPLGSLLFREVCRYVLHLYKDWYATWLKVRVSIESGNFLFYVNLYSQETPHFFRRPGEKSLSN